MNAALSEEAIFSAAIEKGSPAERAAFLEEACGSNVALQARLAKLLRAHDHPDSFLSAPDMGALPLATPPDWVRDTPAGSELVGTLIGPYKLLEQIGEGGMGVVYVAEQTQPVKRRVALKLIKPGMDSRQVIARFEAERQALAMMDHPNIARVFDAGTIGRSRQTPSAVAEEAGTRSGPASEGCPYFVMELIRGLPITEYCDQARLNPPQRLELFIDVCQAVQHAHHKGIIHRDLKPSNVMITLHDGTPVVKVIDFGVAKALTQARCATEGNPPLTEKTLYTNFGQMIGTPLYMSPEQAELSGLDIDTRSDVYSLGVLLYELLTGLAPFDKERLKNAGFDEMRRIIREDEPPRPSHRISTLNAQAVSTVSQHRGLDQRQLRRFFRGELDSIVMKTLDKDRNRRYESASALAADVQRYLENEPIAARPASAAYRFRKWLRRNPTIASFVVVAVLTIMAVLLGGWYHNHYLAKANLALDAANHSLGHTNQKLNVALGEAQRLESEAVEREKLVRLQTYARDMRFAYDALLTERLEEARTYFDQKSVEPGQFDPRGFEWHWLSNFFPSARQTFAGHAAPLIAADVSPDERWVASGDKAGVIKISDLASGREITTLNYAEAEITSVAFAPNGQTLATAGVDRTIRLFRVSDWSEIGCLRGHDLTVASIAWSPDNKFLASGGRDHTVKIWNVETLREIRSLPQFKDVVRCVAWSPTGKHLTAGVREDGLHLIDTQSWQSQRLPNPSDDDGGALAVAFSPSGKFLALGGYGSRILIHEVQTHKQLADMETPSQIRSIAYSPNEQRLFAGLSSGEVLACALNPHRHRIDTARLFQLGHGPLRAVRPTGHLIVTADEQAAVVQTRFAAQLAAPDRIHRFSTMCLAISAAKDLACTLDSKGVPQLVSFPSGKTLGPLEGATVGQIKGAWFFPTGQRLMVMDGSLLRLYDAITRRHLGDFEASADALHIVAISPQGKYIAATALCAGKWQLCIWNAQTLRRVTYAPVPLPDPSLRLAFAPDEQILAVASPILNQGKVVLWNLATHSTIDEIPETAIADLEFSPDGQLLAIARGWEVMIWNTAERKMTTVLRGHSSNISDLAFSPEGRTLATVDYAGTARLWHVPTRQEIGILSRQAIPASNLLFRSPYQLVNYADPQPTKPHFPCDVIIFDATHSADPFPEVKRSQ